MANVNKVILIGRLTRDPELRYLPGGSAVAEFGLAVNREWSSAQGEKKESTCFVDVVTYGRGAEILNQYMKKGRQVFIEGRLDYSEWQDKEGKKRSRLRVVSESFQFLDGGSGARRGGGEAAAGAPEEGAPAEPSAVREPFPAGGGFGGRRGPAPAPSPADDLDAGGGAPPDDLPF